MTEVRFKYGYQAIYAFIGLLASLMISCDTKPHQKVSTNTDTSVKTEEAFPMTSTLLKDTEWERKGIPQSSKWTMRFTDRQLAMCVSTSVEGKDYSDTCCYYLSSTIVQRFDSAKVGTETQGKYLVMGSDNYFEIVDISISEMTLKYPTSGVEFSLARKSQ